MSNEIVESKNEIITIMDNFYDYVKIFFKNEFEECIRSISEKLDKHLFYCLIDCIVKVHHGILEMNKEIMLNAVDDVEKTLDLIVEYKNKDILHNLRKSFEKVDNENLDERQLIEIELQLINELGHSILFILSAFLFALVDQHLTGFIKAIYRMTSGYLGLKESLVFLNKKKYWSNSLVKDHYEALIKYYLAIFELVISYMPSKLHKLLGWVGFTGDFNTAYEYFKRSIDIKGSSIVLASSFMLLFIESILKFFYGLGDCDCNIVSQISCEFQQNIPNSLIAKFSFGIEKFMNGHFFEAQLLFEEIYKFNKNNDNNNNNNSLPNYIKNLLLWNECWTYAFLNDWKNAATKANLLSTCKWSPVIFNYIYVTFKLMEIEFSQDFSINKEHEINLLCERINLIPTLKRKVGGQQIVYETFIFKRCKKFLKDRENETFLLAYELMFLLQFSILLCKSVEHTNMCLNNIENKINKYKDKINYDDNYYNLLHMKASIYRNINKNNEAQQLFELIIHNESVIKKDKYILAQSSLEIGLIYTDRHDFKNARKWILKAKNNYSGHLTEPLLKYRADLALHSLLNE